MAGVGNLRIRYDHAVLCGMVTLIGVAVVFGVGVERGKRLARSERMLVGPQLGAVPASPESAFSGSSVTPSAGSSADRKDAATSVLQKTTTSPAQEAAPKAPTKVVMGKSKYAIQVVTYSKMTLARQELKQLLGRGEQAFLIDRNDGRMVLCIGPFLTRAHASVRLSHVKQHYQDCFIRTL